MRAYVKSPFCLILFALSVFTRAHAGDTDLRPAGLFEFEGQAGHFLFIARENGSQNVRLFEVAYGHVSSLPLKARSMTYDFGRTLDLYLEDGRRVFVPTEQGRSSLGDPSGPTVTDPERPRKKLLRRTLTREHLSQAKVIHLINPEFFETQTAPSDASEERVFLRDPNRSTLIIVKGTGEVVESYRLSEKVKEIVSMQPPSQAFYLHENLAPGFTVVACDPEIRDKIVENIRELGAYVEEISTIPSLDEEDAGSKTDAIEGLLPGHTLGSRMRALSALQKITLSELSAFEKDQIARAFEVLLDDLEKVYAWTYQAAFYEIRVNVTRRLGRGVSLEALQQAHADARREIESHGLFQKFGRPLRGIERGIFELLHGLNTERSRRIVLKTAGYSGGAGLFLMQEPVAGRTYLDDWLRWYETAIREADGGRSVADRYWSQSRAGGVHEHLGVFGNLQLISLKEGSVFADGNLGAIRSNPLVLLGLSADANDANDAKQAILSFIIQTDKVVARQISIEWGKSDNARDKVTGNLLFDHFIHELVREQNEFGGAVGFSKDRYLSNVLDILIELIETSAITLKTDGTYHSILDTALGLLDTMQDRPAADEKGELSQKTTRLLSAIQRNFLRAVKYLDPGTPACELMLGVDPYKAWLKHHRRIE